MSLLPQIVAKIITKQKQRTLQVLFSLIIVLFILYLIIQLFFTKDRILDPTKDYDLAQDGFCVIKSPFSKSDVAYMRDCANADDYKSIKEHIMKSPKLKTSIERRTGPDYEYQDYIFVIKKSAVHTCHRDNNGDFFNEGQEHPSYTMLVFLEPMEKCLGLVPESHKSQITHVFNLTNQVQHTMCDPGDVVLFNANMIHVGAMNDDGDDHLRIQMKVTHKRDREKISYYENFNKILKEENKMPMQLRKMQRNLSCMFPSVSDMMQPEAKKNVEGVDVGYAQKMFSWMFYGNKDFYDLPNAF